MPTWVDLSFSEARDFLLRKRVVTRADFDALLAEESALAFTVTGVNKLDILQHVLDRVTDAIAKGDTLAEFDKAIEEILSTAGLDPLSPWRTETIFRTGVQSAYGRGRYEQMIDPDIAGEGWGWRYLTVNDDRVREEHALLEGHVFLQDETQFFPPWDFNCRCSSEVILRDEAIAEGLTAGHPLPPGVEGALGESRFTSPAVSYDYTPDLSGFHPALAGAYLEEQRGRE